MTVLNISLFVGVLMVLVLVHEAGHMVVAKWCGMRVERFSIFFGRAIARFRRGETEYAIGWLPAGGYVKITGMTREEDLPPELEPRAYYAATTGRKVATIFAGPAVNFILAFLLFVVIGWVGLHSATTTDRIRGVEEGSPAAAIGLSAGDRLISVNGVPATARDDLEGIRRELQENPDREVSVVYRRDGEVITRSAAPERQSDGTGRLGVVFETDLGPRESEGTLGAFVFAWDVNRELLQQYGTFVRKIVTGDEEARSQVNTVVGIGARFDDEVRETPDLLLSLLGFMASLSFALALFNLIPILPLDGGHILFALIEKVRGSPVSRAAYERASIIGLVAMLLLFVLVLQNDVTLITGDGVVNQP